MYGRHRAGSASANTSVPRGSHAHEGTRDATSHSRPEGVAGEARPRAWRTRRCPKRRSLPLRPRRPRGPRRRDVTLARPTCLGGRAHDPRRRPASPPSARVGPGANATRSPCISFAPVQRTRAGTSKSYARTSSDVAAPRRLVELWRRVSSQRATRRPPRGRADLYAPTPGHLWRSTATARRCRVCPVVLPQFERK